MIVYFVIPYVCGCATSFVSTMPRSRCIVCRVVAPIIIARASSPCNIQLHQSKKYYFFVCISQICTNLPLAHSIHSHAHALDPGLPIVAGFECVFFLDFLKRARRNPKKVVSCHFRKKLVLPPFHGVQGNFVPCRFLNKCICPFYYTYCL